MVVEFQLQLLQYLVQVKKADRYISYLHESIFDLPEHQIIFGLLEGYEERYHTLPKTAENLLEFFDRLSKKRNVNKDQYKVIDTAIRKIFVPFEADTKIIVEEIKRFSQYKQTRKLFTKYSDKIQEGYEVFDEINLAMDKIAQIGKDDEDNENNRGTFLLADHGKDTEKHIQAHETPYAAWTRMATLSGFYSPQVITIMAAPKSFKTGLLINVAVHYVRDGLKVYYADCENGKERIRSRSKQCMLSCTYNEYKDGGNDKILDSMVKKYAAMGGDMMIDFYPPKQKTMADIERRLQELKDEQGWIPDLVCIDYADLLMPINSRITDKRLQIQDVYFDMKAFNVKHDTFIITLSQVNKNAVNKAVLNMGDIAEDFGKIANADAIFGWCATPEEADLGIRRIVPVAQREGVATGECILDVDPARMTITETTERELEERIEKSETEKDANSNEDKTDDEPF